MTPRLRFRALTLPLLLAACGPRVAAPSLAPRPVERVPVDFPSAPVETAVPADPAFAARVASFVAAAERADGDFHTAQAEAARVIARGDGAAPGSEAWTVAQQALSTLEVARDGVRDAAAGLDALRREPGAAGSGSRTALDAAAGRIGAIEQDQSRAMAALAGRLR